MWVMSLLELVGLYVFATSGAAVVAVADRTGLTMPIVAAGAAVGVFVLRLVAMWRHWTAPSAINWRARR
jgi:uncharacterized membrane protein YeiH